MDVLVRERRKANTTVEILDREVSGSEITIGSAPDQAVQLLGSEVAPRHAVLSLSGRGVRIECARGRTVAVRGKLVRVATLHPGDHFDIGGHDIEVIDAPVGFDFAIMLTPNDTIDAAAFESAFRTRLDQALLGKRRLSWLLLVVVLTVGLVTPLMELRIGGGGELADANAGVDGSGDASLGALLTEALARLPDDRFWSTGELLPAHDLKIGDDCSTCHTRLFQRVQDEQCTQCHSAVLDHLAAPVDASIGSLRCATCHKEHNDPRYFIVRRDSLCTQCHAAPHQLPPESGLRSVSSFSREGHPSFDVLLLVPRPESMGNVLSFEWVHRIESPGNAQEQSNLRYPHDLHLDGDKVQDPTDGFGLVCGDCHVLSSDREHFLPIRMERHCRGCHELTFDETNPRRQLPHGEPAEVVFALEGHFMREFGDPNRTQERVPPRRLPDRLASEVCAGGAYECAVARTVEEVENQFSRRGCVTCHVVEDNGGENIYDRFQVHPARLQTDYYPSSKFPHSQHLTQGDVAGDEACLTCHKATTSTVSTDVLIPDIDICLDCHDSAAGLPRVPLRCTSCHAYHPSSLATVIPYPE